MDCVYFKTSDLNQEQLRGMQDIMVESGAVVYDNYTETQGYNYWGIDFDAEIRVYDESNSYGVDSVEVEPTPEALRKVLGLPIKEVESILKENIPLRDVKLRVLSEEQSKAFQEAVFESGGEWWSSSSPMVPIYLSKPYLYVDEEGIIGYGGDEFYFNKHAYKEITLTPKTTWEVAYEGPKTHTLNGEYTNEELLKLIQGE